MEAAKEPFVVDSLSKAEWAMKKIAKIRAEIEKKREQAAIMKADVDEWLTNETTEAKRSLAYFEALLQSYAVNELAGGKKKSLTLPSGKIGFRSGATRFTFGDTEAGAKNQALTDYLVSQDAWDYLDKKISVKWNDFKRSLHIMNDGRVVDETGTVLEGMRAQRCDDEFFVKTGVAVNAE